MDILSDSILRHTDNGADVESDGGFPGFDSVSMVGVLAKFDPSPLDEDGLLEVMVEAQRIVAAAQARQVKAMAELSRRRPRALRHPFGEFVADEVAVELCLTRRAAENRLSQAVEMTSRTPAIPHALEAGALDLYGVGHHRCDLRVGRPHRHPSCHPGGRARRGTERLGDPPHRATGRVAH